ncbi:MAG: Na+/H+ antiporter NhaA [Pseudomonadales bacterium]|nr:Na+/H+ antiporter NhaA [Pseudomonadales bacterium]
MSSSGQSSSPETPQGVYHAPWEKAFARITSPLEEFIHSQATTGLLLMAMASLALVLANSGLADEYEAVKHLYAGFSIGSWDLRLSLQHWVNDGLMALFFFVVGLELKREMLVGELASPRQAILPIIAALGGMVVPALIYTAFNYGSAGALGWGVPMATDIAFAIGILVLLGDRIPRALVTFLIALAIVDDLGAVVVIALFYTENIAVSWLLPAALILGLLIILNLAGIRRTTPYFLLAVLLWYTLLQSGVHATLAGVLGAFTVPARAKYDPAVFSAHVKRLLVNFDTSYQQKQNIMLNSDLHAITQTLQNGILRVQPSLLRLEHAWHLPVAFLVIPVFALFNAGIPIAIGSLAEVLSHPVTLGVGAGLVVGKFVGITGASWLTLKLGLAQLPATVRFSQIAGVSLLGGIGFTMAIFIAELAFVQQPDVLLMAKTGILLASLAAGVSGLIWLYLCAPKAGTE